MNPEQIDALVREQGPFVFDRMFETMEKVRERLERVCHALGKANIPYAIVGGNAVAAWVSTRDEGAIRNTQDVDILLRTEDLDAASSALRGVGFIPDRVMDVTIFRDGVDGKPSQAVHVVWAGKKIRTHHLSSAPMPDQVRDLAGKRVIDLVELVRMKLNSFRDKDRVHLRDLIGVGLIDSTWPEKFALQLNERLHEEEVDSPKLKIEAARRRLTGCPNLIVDT